jgi:hypothetical protein
MFISLVYESDVENVCCICGMIFLIYQSNIWISLKKNQP